MSGELTLQVNGAAHTAPSSATVADLVRLVVEDDASARAVAVARNGEIVPRAEWQATALVEGDAIEIVRPVQGGSIQGGPA